MSPSPARTPRHTATVGAVGGALGWSVITRLFQFALSLIGSIFVVRALGADRYGQLTVLRTSLAFLTAICGLGLGQAALRYLPGVRALGDRALAGRLIRLVVLPQFLAWGASILVVLALRGFVAKLSFPAMAELFFLGSILAGAELAFLAAGNVTTAFFDTRSLSLVTLIGAVVYLVVAVIALRLGYGVPGVLVSTAVAQLVMAILLARRIGRLLTGMQPGKVEPIPAEPPREGPPGARTLLRYALPFGAIAVMNLLTWRQSESLLLAHFRTLREAGFWNLAYQMPQMILEFVPGAIWPLMMAGFSEIYTRDRGALDRAMRAYYKLLFLLVTPIAVIGAAVGDRAIVAFYGEPMHPAGVWCQLLFLVFTLSFFSTPMTMAFYVLEKPWYSFWQYLFNSIVLVGLDFILIPKFGLLGAIIPLALVIGASPIINAWLLRRLNVRAPIPWGFLGRVFLAAVPCMLLYPARFVVRGKVPVALAAMAAGVLYLAGLKLFRVLGEEEAGLLRRSRLPFAERIISFLVRREGPVA